MLLTSPPLDSLSLVRPIVYPKIWLYLAWMDTVNQYRRTIFGPFWILLSLIIFSVCMGSVYSGLFSIAFNQYISYVTAGMIGWNWAAAILVTSGTVYTANAGMLSDYPTNKAYLLWSHVMSQFVIFVHQLPLMTLFYLIGLLPVSTNMLYLIPSLALVFMINLGAGSMLSIVVNRYRDLNRIMGSLVIIIMMTTPIFWMPTMFEGHRSLIYLLNPFYYIIEIIRDPLLGKPPNLLNYTVASLMALVFMVAGSIIHKKYSPSVVFRL